ncbi:IS200/IS605 family transposase [Parahaliea mediterranea]|uniref:IS200/IS605 family transposase n=1 Tax=Parahaliea mediterranea TaxID=651086 RepID=A0A939DJQ1_9GAMM|nr:IS200/IS605 family transposase [Parahaliea mediterranea]MBN7799213.1 IS200/IS605 family transposase [Parahaliea mediterranea]
MSRFEKLTHVIWHCQYHLVWVPKYRYRVLKGEIAQEVINCIQVYSSRLGCRIVELNVQPDHVHLLLKVPPKESISRVMGVVKGKTALRLFTRFPYLREKPYWGNHFWAKGYCVDTVGLDATMIRTYVKYQEKQEQKQVRMDLRR